MSIKLHARYRAYGGDTPALVYRVTGMGPYMYISSFEHIRAMRHLSQDWCAAHRGSIARINKSVEGCNCDGLTLIVRSK
jgi:hypothetical protein